MGSLTTNELPICSSNWISSITWGIELNVTVGSPAWMIIDRLIGMPSSWAMTVAMSMVRACRPSAMRCRYFERSSAEVAAQLSRARLAACAALSTSSGVASGTRPMTSSVAALTTSMVLDPVDGTHAPSM